MARILWLPGVLRAAGIDVVEEPGWRTRGRDDFAPYGLIAHATAGGRQQSNDSAVSTIINGRPGLSGPIGQAMIERGTGRWRIVASGAGNHAKTGWAGPLKGHGNRTLIGVECHHDNLSEPWTEAVWRSYVVGFAAICRHMGWDPQTRIAAHKEHQPGEKSDPTFAPGVFRADVAAYLNGDDDVLESSPAGVNTHDRVYALYSMTDKAGENNALADAVREIKADIVELKTRPAGVLTLTPEAVATLGPLVEAAVRRVLGAVDGAVPPGGG